MTATKKNRADGLAAIGEALGVRGKGKSAGERLVRRPRGKPIDMQTRLLVAMRLAIGGVAQRVIARDTGVSTGSVSNIKARLVEHGVQIAAAVANARTPLPPRQALWDALRGRKRVGGAAKRKIGSAPEHAAFVRALLEQHDARLQLAELCRLFERRFGVRVAVSTMCRFVKRALQFSRQRVQRQLPQQALTEKNAQLRRQFVANWFAGADAALVGTNDEQRDQQAHWRLGRGHRGVQSVEQLFWIDETGCNRHTLLRRYGYGPRGRGGVRCAGLFDGQKGRNHSVIIAVHRSGGVVARQVLVGSEQQRGTRRDDFCRFLERDVAPAMLRSAAQAGVPSDAPLLLMMDNASIHKGAVVSEALKRVSPRLGVAYQPPYMPTVNPVELVNNQLKAKLKSRSLERTLKAIESRVSSMDPLGGVVSDAPIDKGGAVAADVVDDASLRRAIERVLDRDITAHHVAGYVAHCGWR